MKENFCKSYKVMTINNSSMVKWYFKNRIFSCILEGQMASDVHWSIRAAFQKAQYFLECTTHGMSCKIWKPDIFFTAQGNVFCLEYQNTFPLAS